MRIVVAVALYLAAGAAWAQPRIFPRYDFYIFERAEGGETTYAVSSGERATAAAVTGCDGRILHDASAVVAHIAARAREDDEGNDLSVVTLAPGGTIHLGSCARRDEEEEPEYDSDDPEDKGHEEDRPHDSIVWMQSMSASQTRRVISEMDALTREERAQMLTEIGLQR